MQQNRSLGRRRNPVSYTHLDVYKRQMEDCLPKEMYSKLKANEDYKERSITLFQKYYEDYHMESDVALKEAIRDSAKKFLDAAKAELVEEKGRNSKG